MTSSYLRTSLRISALRPSTVFWARSIALVTIFASMGTSSGRARPITQLIAPVAKSRMQLVLEARGRSGSRPGRPGGRSGPAAGCRCAGSRGARCPARRGRRAPLTRGALRLATPLRSPGAFARGRRLPRSVPGSDPRLATSCRARPSGLPAEDDVDASAGHVGGHGHRVPAGRPGRRSRPPGSAAWRSGPRGRIPRLSSSRESSSDFSTDAVPDEHRLARSAGARAMSSTTALNLASSVL